MGFNLDDYEPVADRIERFWKDHEQGRITTDLVHRDDKSFIVKAMIWRNAASDNEWSGPDSTGYAEEVIGSTNVNRTSALENCETSAIGRALANLGYAVKNRASREEMAKAQPAPRPRSGPQKRTPTPPESQENDDKAPENDLKPNVAAEVARMKRWAVEQLSGDVEKASKIWGNVLKTYETDKNGTPYSDSLGFIESDLSIAVGEALTGFTDVKIAT